MAVRGFAVPFDVGAFEARVARLAGASDTELREALVDLVDLDAHSDDLDLAREEGGDVLALAILILSCVSPEPVLFELGAHEDWTERPDGIDWPGPEDTPMRLAWGPALDAFCAMQPEPLRDWLKALPPGSGVAFGWGDLPAPWPDVELAPLSFEAQARAALARAGLPAWAYAAVEVLQPGGVRAFEAGPALQPGARAGRRAFVFVDYDNSPGLVQRHHAYALEDGAVMRWDPPPPPGLLTRMVMSLRRSGPVRRPPIQEGRCARVACPLCDAAEVVAGVAEAD